MTGLENFLKDSESDAEQSVTETPPESIEAAPEEPKAETLEATTEETAPEEQEDTAKPEIEGEQDVSTPETEKTMVPLAALKNEREKRQALEKQIEESSTNTAPDFIEDPEGAFEHQRKQNAEQFVDMKVNVSIQAAKAAHKDFDEVVDEATWKEMVSENPTLLQQSFDSDNPALFAYEKCKSYKQMKEIGDPATFRERLKAEILKELEDDTEAKNSRENIPDSLASIPAATSKEPVWQGDEPLGKLVGPKRQKAS